MSNKNFVMPVFVTDGKMLVEVKDVLNLTAACETTKQINEYMNDLYERNRHAV